MIAFHTRLPGRGCFYSRPPGRCLPKSLGGRSRAAFPHFPSISGRKIPVQPKTWENRNGRSCWAGQGGSAGWEFLTLFPLGKSTLSQSKSNPVYPSPIQTQFIPVQLKSSLSQSKSPSWLRFKFNFQDLGFFPSIQCFWQKLISFGANKFRDFPLEGKPRLGSFRDNVIHKPWLPKKIPEDFRKLEKQKKQENAPQPQAGIFLP